MGIKIVKQKKAEPSPEVTKSLGTLEKLDLKPLSAATVVPPPRQVQFSPISGDRVMGLDISTKTGLVVLDGKEAQVIQAREIALMDREPENAVDRVMRMKVIEENIDHEIRKHRPAFIAMEGYGYANIYTLATLAELGGVIRLMCYRMKIPFIEVTPMSLKKFACGDHKAKKDKVRLGVYKRWGYEHDSDNVVDAYVLAQVGLAFKGIAAGLNVPQMEVLGTLRSRKQQFLDPETAT